MEEILKSKNDKAAGPFCIPVRILKIIRHVVSRTLEAIFNLSFSTGIVPSSVKIAKVIPVSKKGSCSHLNNYRLISLLSVFDKLLEKLMYKRIVNYLDKNSILYEKQFGFRTKHSTNHAIISIVDNIQRVVEEKEFSCGIFLDFSKAFDTVNHEILIRKLENYGIRGITNDWFRSYLSNRKQYVYINNTSSDPCQGNCGIPQGSVLGPLLFLIYINDFSRCSTLFDFHLFADDSNLFYKRKSLSVLQSDINRELSKVQEWLCVNRLALNIKKSNYVKFHLPQRKMLCSPILEINEKHHKREFSIRYLGIFIDSHLNWKSQVTYIVKKINRSIGVISKLRYYLNRITLINLYNALIYPFLIYGIIIWGNTYPTTTHPLLVLQKKATRIMTFSQLDAHTNPLKKPI